MAFLTSSSIRRVLYSASYSRINPLLSLLESESVVWNCHATRGRQNTTIFTSTVYDWFQRASIRNLQCNNKPLFGTYRNQLRYKQHHISAALVLWSFWTAIMHSRKEEIVEERTQQVLTKRVLNILHCTEEESRYSWPGWRGWKNWFRRQSRIRFFFTLLIFLRP